MKRIVSKRLVKKGSVCALHYYLSGKKIWQILVVDLIIAIPVFYASIFLKFDRSILKKKHECLAVQFWYTYYFK